MIYDFIVITLNISFSWWCMGNADVDGLWGWAKIYPKEKNPKTISLGGHLFPVI